MNFYCQNVSGTTSPTGCLSIFIVEILACISFVEYVNIMSEIYVLRQNKLTRLPGESVPLLVSTGVCLLACRVHFN